MRQIGGEIDHQARDLVDSAMRPSGMLRGANV
jgi:hypothetical protein